MKHVKMPIRADGKPGASWIEDANGNVFAVSSFANLDRLNEIVQAVNAYDSLVAQRDDLVTQRDALVALAEGIVKGWNLGDWIPPGYVEEAKAALALVKGDQKSDDADQD